MYMYMYMCIYIYIYIYIYILEKRHEESTQTERVCTSVHLNVARTLIIYAFCVSKLQRKLCDYVGIPGRSEQPLRSCEDPATPTANPARLLPGPSETQSDACEAPAIA